MFNALKARVDTFFSNQHMGHREIGTRVEEDMATRAGGSQKKVRT